MNEANVKVAIAIMERARGKVDMTCWQGSAVPAATEADLHACGNTACFAGWIAVSPEFHASGGFSDEDTGEPRVQNAEGFYMGGVYSIADWLGVDAGIAYSLVHGRCEPECEENVLFSHFYNKPWVDVNADDVIAKLQLILAGELS